MVDSVLVVPPYMGDGIPTGNQTIVYTRKALYYGAFWFFTWKKCTHKQVYMITIGN